MDEPNEHYIDLTVFDAEGERIGTVTDVIVDPENLQPWYLTVKTGRLDPLTGEHVLPVVVVERQGDGLVVPFDRSVVQHAPRLRQHTPPDREQQELIAQHYRV